MILSTIVLLSEKPLTLVKGSSQYHKDYKKFKKLYNKCADENRFDALFECIPYKKCRCDWDIVSYTNQMKEFANELIDTLIPESRNKFEMSSLKISEAHKIEV